MKINHIKQKHSNGCGVACAAMVSGVSYNTAVEAYKRICGTETSSKIVSVTHRLLDTLLIALNRTPRRDLSDIYGEIEFGHVYIMGIPPQQGKTGHYVVLDTRKNKYVLHDPLISRNGKLVYPNMWSSLVKIRELSVR